ncbi:hypothetical protein [Stenotrophomonas maltophilia]|uniref:hypothetical protein n=1 Tax=Stenotrophomonas maltophilia TaxID=40324 RepID=UPI00301802E4
MSAFLARHLRYIRLGLFVLMLLSVVVRPVVIQLGELHAFEHDVAAAADHGHSDGAATGDNVDPKHASGVHGILHKADVSFAGTLLSPYLNLTPISPASVMLGLGLVGGAFGPPLIAFRPPIV